MKRGQKVRRVSCVYFAGRIETMLFCDNPMHAFADGDDVNDLHVAHVRFGGDVLLKPGSQRTGEQNADDCQSHGNGQEQDLCQRGFCPSKHRPAQGRGKKRGGRQVGAASRMDRQSAFTLA